MTRIFIDTDDAENYEDGLQCVSAYKIKLEKKLTKEYAKEIVAKLTDGFVYGK